MLYPTYVEVLGKYICECECVYVFVCIYVYMYICMCSACMHVHVDVYMFICLIYIDFKRPDYIANEIIVDNESYLKSE